ncbi:MAG: DUF2812 domain-containing protein [Clostridiales bacterium]|nr:DUF2812 domain-containing protein [Clostridiales bacterium]
MRKVVWKLFVDYEKEEKWLNDMAAKGLAFEDYSFARYVFSDCKPGEYIYRIELLENSFRNPESQQYLSFMSETGAEPVANWFRWIYFRKKAAEGVFELYSDIESKIAHFNRIMWLFFIIMCMEIVIGLSNINIGLQFRDGIHDGAPANFVIGVVCVCIGIVLFFPFNRTRLQVKKLRQDKLLME